MRSGNSYSAPIAPVSPLDVLKQPAQQGITAVGFPPVLEIFWKFQAGFPWLFSVFILQFLVFLVFGC
jgi:hypothetical protein